MSGESIPLANGDSDTDYDLEPSLTRNPRRISTKPPTRFCTSLIFALGFILGTSISAFITPYLVQHGINADVDQQCSVHTSYASPVLNDVDIAYSTTVFNGSFMHETVYRRPGSPEVDSAWEALGIEYRPSIIREEEGLASGLTRHHVQRTKKYGGGYFVNVEGLHHLHCLNIVRKSLYFNYEYYKATHDYIFDDDEDIRKFHITHCLDTIRQVLICNVDTGVLGQVWTRQLRMENPQAFPDFNTKHKCKNYEAVRAWAEEHQALPNQELPDDYVASPEEGDVLPFVP
ncbi:hypothetical protein F4803DRAFT_531539 [Xylaria telfairii]|nr:hypothetical protein F4803DRAFT_531539 [Xylaria telfairii]